MSILMPMINPRINVISIIVMILSSFNFILWIGDNVAENNKKTRNIQMNLYWLNVSHYYASQQ